MCDLGLPVGFTAQMTAAFTEACVGDVLLGQKLTQHRLHPLKGVADGSGRHIPRKFQPRFWLSSWGGAFSYMGPLDGVPIIRNLKNRAYEMVEM